MEKGVWRMQPTPELTLQIVDAITEYQAQHGYPLSILELASICKVSAGVMYRLLLKMEQQGIIEMPLRQHGAFGWLMLRA
jgi:DNA-binding PadR family transcriptional regulator